MPRNLVRSTALAVLLGCTCLTPAFAQAPIASTTNSNSITIAAQDLSTALLALGRQTGRVVSFAPATVAGKRSGAVQAAPSFEAALQQMLVGTGLQFAIAQDGSASVVQPRASAVAPAAPRVVPTATEPPPEEVMVTGSRIRGALPSSPVIRLSQEQIRDAGLTSLADVIRTIPQNFAGGQSPGLSLNMPTSAGENIGSGSALNLRGLGADATLTLVNGHRFAYGGNRQSIDVGAVPLDALSRIEIVADGASAIYGSDAVAGVANIVLKRDFDGVAVRTRFGGSTDGGGFQQQDSIVGGTSWGTGGFIAAYDYERDTAITTNDRDYLRKTNPGLTLYPGMMHHNALVSVYQDLSDRLRASLDTLYNWRRDFRTYQVDTIATPHAYGFSSRSQTFTAAPSLTLDVAGDWKASAIGTYSIDRISYANNSVYAGTVTPVLRNCYCNTGKSAEVNADGSLFALAGGNAKLAVGAGYRSNDFRSGGSIGGAPVINGGQDAYFGFAELNLPLVSAAQRMPLVNQLNLSAALRYEDYPGLDRVVTPKLGAVWAPSADFDLKASWGKSFKAPTMFQRYQEQTVSNYNAAILGGASYPAGSTALFLFGGSPSLQAERATTWSVTATAHPAFLGGARLELSYFNVDYTDRVLYPVISIGQALSTPAYRSSVQLNPSAAQIAAALGSRSFYNNASGPYDPSKVVAIVDDRAVNAASQLIHGVDLAAEAPFDLGRYGSLLLNANASLLFSKQQNTSDVPFFNLAGTLYSPAHFRARGGATWIHDALTISSFVNYTGGVSDTSTVPNPRIGAMTTLDANLRYALPLNMFRSSEITLSAQNIFNAKPDLVRITTPAQAAFDSTNYSIVGRFVSVSFAVQW